MLILSRRPNESLVIGDNSVVTILGIKGAQVRLGIAASREVVVDREEVHQHKQAESDAREAHPSRAGRPQPNRGTSNWPPSGGPDGAAGI
jgi:carbon storage regulator